MTIVSCVLIFNKKFSVILTYKLWNWHLPLYNRNITTVYWLEVKCYLKKQRRFFRINYNHCWFQKYKTLSLVGNCIDILLIMVFLVLLLLTRIMHTWMGLSNYMDSRTFMCYGLIYFFYRLLGVYLPISPTLGPMLLRISRMVSNVRKWIGCSLVSISQFALSNYQNNFLELRLIFILFVNSSILTIQSLRIKSCKQMKKKIK